MMVECKKDQNINIVRSCSKETRADIWLIHGFTECSDSLIGVLNTSLTNDYNIFIPDLPGCGKSVFKEKHQDLTCVVGLLVALINQHSTGRPIIIIGHSLGATIGTMVCEKLVNVELFINVEGMLVEDKNSCRSLTSAEKFKCPDDFIKYMCSRLEPAAENNKYVRRYIENILASNPIMIHSWAKSSTCLLADNHIEAVYNNLLCHKIYIQGEKTMSILEKQHLVEKQYSFVVIPGSGHWPMHEAADSFWKTITDIISIEHCGAQN